MSDNIARGLGDLMREAQHSLAADAAEAPAEVVKRARSRHRRAGGLLGAVAIAACVAVGAAGIGVAQGSTPESLPSLSPSATDPSVEDLSVPLATATIPIDGGPEYEGIASLIECGAPAPEASGTVEHFDVTIAEPPPLTIAPDALLTGQGADVETWITYDSLETVPVAQLPVTLVLVKDGKVEGSFRPDEAAQRYWTYSNFDTFYGGSSLMPFGTFCPNVSTAGPDDLGWRVLNPGEYQVIPVTRVWANEEAAALKYLYKNGVTVGEYPEIQHPAGFLPGSWDCKQAVESLVYQIPVPRACLGDVTGNAIVDAEAGTVRLPYDPEQLTKTLDLILVGDPVALNVREPFEVPGFDSYTSKPLDATDPIECGTTFDYVTPEAPVQVSGQMPAELGIGKGAFNTTNAYILPTAQGSGELKLEYGAKAWLVAGVTEDYNYFQERPGNEQVVGTADVFISNGNSAPYDRFAGPTLVDLVFSNVTICEGYNQDLGVTAALIDGNISMTPAGEPQAEPAHQLLYFRQYFGN